MAKDPAFLFYTNDFISGTQFFTNEEVGIYIRLLCAQHQHGRLSEKQVLFICKSFDSEVMQKFTKDSDGFYYNERLEIEIIKRQSFSESRRKNREGKTKDSIKPPKKKSKSYVKHMENENEDENINNNEFINTINSFIEFRKQLKKPLTEHGLKLINNKLNELSKDDEKVKIDILNQSIMRGWAGVFPIKETEKPKENNFINGININEIDYKSAIKK
jgi:uncharacterized protein YdaU (DUF1376 family)